MGSFVSFALIGGMSVMVMLMWRLYVAVQTQHDIENSFASTSETLEIEKATATELAQEQCEKVTRLTAENQALHQQSEQHCLAIAQLQSDHQTLQQKYSELEQNLIGNIAKEKKQSDTLQTYKLEKAKLLRQIETLQATQTKREKEQKTLLTQHKEISEKHQKYQQLIQAAKEKISTLEKDKNQLERDLQQALYQVVKLEEQTRGPELISHHNQTETDKEYTFEPCLPTFMS